MRGDRSGVIVPRNVTRDEHTRICVPEPVCHRCFKPWPCGDVVWAHDIVLREDLPSP